MNADAKKEYWKHMFGDSNNCKCNGDCNKSPPCYYQKAQNALNRAHEIRKFEIELVWKRTTYAATFQGFLFAALAVLSTADGGTVLQIMALQLIISNAGMFSAILWKYINQGSKFWQENWEHHIDFLENEFEGRLHKTVLHESSREAYSVSRANITLSCGFFFIWFLLVAYFLLSLIFYKVDSDIPTGLAIAVAIFSLFLLSIFLCSTKLKTKFKNKTTEESLYLVKRESATGLANSDLTR